MSTRHNPPELARLRAEVNRIDSRLVDLMAARQALVEAIAAVKGDPSRVRDREREEAVIARVGQAARRAGLSLDIALPVWRRLLDASVAHERAVLAAREGRPDTCCGCRSGHIPTA